MLTFVDPGAYAEVESHFIGARFFRADLHIHSFGASHDVKDSTSNPDNIVATAIKEGLSIIAVADHNEISNVESVLKTADMSGITAIPAVELSTPQGHLLCYLPSLEALQRFHGQLTIVDRHTQNSRCQESILECLKILEPLGGFGILAHVDVESGYEHDNPGSSPHKFDVIAHTCLLGIELKNANSQIFYSPNDTNSDRKRMGEKRIEKLGLGERQFLARVLNSDAHTLNSLGRNAQNARRVTRYKMDKPSFGSLRIALEDADARVRIEDLVPSTIPRIVGMKISGGFLNQQVFHFGPNLNCIIGGRGTGKSTAFESIRCLAEGESESKVVDSEVWPEELILFWQDEAGQTFGLNRDKNATLCNIDSSNPDLPNMQIDCFGQGEAARISVQAQSNPLALLNYLDKFIGLQDALEQETQHRNQLLELQTEIEKAESRVQLIPQYESSLKLTQQQLTALQKPDVKELIELQRKLDTEREVQRQMNTCLQDVKRDIAGFGVKSNIKKFKEIASPGSLTIGSAEFQQILNAIDKLEGEITSSETQISKSVGSFEDTLSTQLSNWKQKEAEAQKRIDTKRRELESLNVAFDMSYISKLTRDEASQVQTVKNLQTWKPHLAELQKTRNKKLEERWKARSKVALLRDAFGRKASAILGESLSDLHVSLKYRQNSHSPEALDQIISVMGWRTNQQLKAGWLIEDLTIPKLLEAITKKDHTTLLSLKTPEGVQVFRPEEAQEILKRLSAPAVKFMLERVAIYDLPSLQVTKKITESNGNVRYAQRDFAKLSLGQQQSVLLALMLSSNSNKPLIIDQPEDNLDGEFIYSTLVPVLRLAKERRQVIIVTHNPNVAVLGDAELIIVMKAANDRGIISSRGSIDNEDTRSAACGILEGARDAFIRRAKMYGITVTP